MRKNSIRNGCVFYFNWIALRDNSGYHNDNDPVGVVVAPLFPHFRSSTANEEEEQNEQEDRKKWNELNLRLEVNTICEYILFFVRGGGTQHTAMVSLSWD